MNSEKQHNWCIIMAGGIGSRFWPISRNRYPKQFLDILGFGKSFLQMTYERFLKIVPSQRIMIVTSLQFKDIVMQQIPDIDPGLLLLEPSRCNTAPCIAYASYKILKRDPAAKIVVAPSDHLIMNEELFLSTIESAFAFAGLNDALITLGIKPTRPETGYGYIQALRSQGQMVNNNFVYPVKTFTEKPSLEMAKILVDSGEFYWNSGIFIWSVNSIVAQLAEQLGDVNALFASGMDYYWSAQEQDFVNGVYEQCRSVSIDYGVMEKAPNCYVFPSGFYWSDLGSWDSYYLHTDKDSLGNSVKAEKSLIKETKESLVLSTCRDKLTVVSSLDNYMVIDTPQVLLVCPRESGEFKSIINEIAFKHEDYA